MGRLWPVDWRIQVWPASGHPTDAPPGRTNYWGYQPLAFFAPHHGYSSSASPLGVLDEFGVTLLERTTVNHGSGRSE